MKIVVNARFLIKDKLEGIGWFSHEVLRRMVEAHPEDEFIFLFDRPFDDTFLYAPNVKGVQLFPPARHPFLWYLWFEIAVKRYLNKHKPDAFFSPDGYLSLKASCPQVMVCHDIAFMHYPEYVPKLVNKYYRHYTPKFLKRADRVVTVSEFVKSDIYSTYNTPKDKIVVANNAAREAFEVIDEGERNAIQDQFTSGQPYFLYVGAIHPRKNVGLILKGFEQYKAKYNSDLKLVLLGRMAWQTDEFEQQLKHSPYAKDIVLPGYCTSETLVKITAGARAMVYVSKSEGFGIPLLEAMRCDVPLIISDKTSLPEVAGDAALKVGIDDHEQLAEHMNSIHTSESLRSDLISKGRSRVSFYTWERAANVCYAAILEAIRA